MLPPDLKRKAEAEARKLQISFADFIRQAVIEKLPRQGKGFDRLRQRRRDPLFRLLDRAMLVKRHTPADTAEHHDAYVYDDPQHEPAQ
jgi:hypothetical protein